MAGNQVMTTFVVASGADKNVLLGLANQARIPFNVIIRPQSRRIQPRPDPPGVLSVATCLVVENDWVWNVLLDWGGIGNTALVDNKPAAEAMLSGGAGSFDVEWACMDPHHDTTSDPRPCHVVVQAIGVSLVTSTPFG